MIWLRADLAVVPSGTTAAQLLAIDTKQLEGLGVPFMHTVWHEQVILVSLSVLKFWIVRQRK